MPTEGRRFLQPETRSNMAIPYRKSPKGECPRCGGVFRLSQFKKEWTGLRVCHGTGTHDCWDPKPADTRPPKVKPEGVPLPNAQPETEPVFAKFTDGDHL
jgi:hypothetical protein